MKIRNGFVSNSSSSSFIINYKDGAFLKDAKEIYDYINQHPSDDLYIVGKDLGEGKDFFTLEKDYKNLIKRFPEKWLLNGEEIQGFIVEDSSLIPCLIDGRSSRDLLYKNVFKFDMDRYSKMDDIVDIYLRYFLDIFDLSVDIKDLPETKPYTLIYRDSPTINSKKDWENIVEDKENYPILISKRCEEDDILRTLLVNSNLPDYEISYKDYFLIEEYDDSLKEIGSKIEKKNYIKVYTKAYIDDKKNKRKIQSPFYIEPLFGFYMILGKEKIKDFL